MDQTYLHYIGEKLEGLRGEGLYKSERVITSKQSADIAVASGERVLNFCANNYLGFANNDSLIMAAKMALDKYGYGMASVRFICGTQEEHKQLESKIATFLGTQDSILYSSCFDANTGLFETLLDESDAIISDSLNHASIIDGVRLCKASRHRYQNNDMVDLEEKLQATQKSRFRMIATDGVFSMDGTIANLAGICDLAEKYDAMVMVDDSHAVGFMGANGKGTPEHCGVSDRVDIITGTLGKALGGASGGYVAGKTVVVDWLRQRSRPYLFSNTLAPVIAAASLKVFDLIASDHGYALREKLQNNSQLFRKEMGALGFDLVAGTHPIIPVMLGEAKLAQEMAAKMLERGVYVIGFAYPVVPQGKARIRTQMSAAHSENDILRAVEIFGKVGSELGLIK